MASKAQPRFTGPRLSESERVSLLMTVAANVQIVKDRLSEHNDEFPSLKRIDRVCDDMLIDLKNAGVPMPVKGPGQ